MTFFFSIVKEANQTKLFVFHIIFESIFNYSFFFFFYMFAYDERDRLKIFISTLLNVIPID
jgi:ribonucleotide reductase beta subunit family protein with ferritin-like domain